MADMMATWSFPTRVLFGPGRVRDLPKVLKGAGIARPLLVTDEGLKDLPLVADILTLLSEAGLEATLFADVKGNPVGRNVEAGVAAYRAAGCDGVLALGGGSGLDAGKVIALMAGQTLPVWDFEEKPGNWRKADPAGIAPIVAVPTTAGTGSEVGRAGVIVDEAAQRKVIIFHPAILPQTVISDPELTVGLPPAITAATGLDAFTHCFEALCAPGYHPMAEGIALKGMEMIARALPAACHDGGDITARGEMLAAASMGAVAFQKGLGGVHALAHAIGGLFDTHHGLTNAILLPYLIERNAPAIGDKMALLGRVLGLSDPTPAGISNWVLGFRAQLGIPETLTEIGVTADRAEDVGALAAQDNCALGNPIPLEAKAYVRLFEAALSGDLGRAASA